MERGYTAYLQSLNQHWCTWTKW